MTRVHNFGTSRINRPRLSRWGLGLLDRDWRVTVVGPSSEFQQDLQTRKREWFTQPIVPHEYSQSWDAHVQPRKVG